MEDAKALEPTVLADAHHVRGFIQEVARTTSRTFGQRAADALAAADRLLENAQQSQPPPPTARGTIKTADIVREHGAAITPPEAFARASLLAELKRLAERDDDTMRWINEANELVAELEKHVDARLEILTQNDDALSTAINSIYERVDRLEAAVARLEAGNLPLAGDVPLSTRPEDRHQGLSDPMG